MNHCNYYKQNICQTCTFLGESYQRSLQVKFEALEKLFPGLKVSKIVASPLPLGSRAKTKWAIGIGPDSNIKFGFPDATGKVLADIRECPQHRPEINQITQFLEDLLKHHNIIPYDIEMQKGELKFLTITSVQDGQQVMLRFTLRSLESHERMQKLARDLQKALPRIKVICATIQPKHEARRDGEKEIFYTSDRFIQDRINDILINYGPQSFIQVNPEIKSLLYQKTAQFFSNKGCPHILDLYCGSGAFAFHLAKACPLSSIYGVEISSEAIALAREAALANKFGNVKFDVLDADKILPHHADAGNGVVVNPPRRGLSHELVQALLQSKTEFLAYSSCNTATLARDYGLLMGQFKLVEFIPYDMFPFTGHLECLALFQRMK